jgi:NAD(P)-dependent dehydrogenase (short-subunit alcohol dehydrogenase family)
MTALPIATITLSSSQRTGAETAMPRLTGRKIVITGGASGIGRATAELFAKEGAAVAVFDRDAAHAEAVSRSIGGTSFAVDVSDAAEVERMVAAAAGVLGGLDGLVNAAGVWLMETGPEIWHQTISVNLTGTFLCVQAAVPFLRQAGHVAIVNIGSGVGLLPTVRSPAPWWQ